MRGFTHISHIFLYLACIKRVGYKVHWFIPKQLLQFEEFSDEKPWTDEEEWWALIRIIAGWVLDKTRKGKGVKEAAGLSLINGILIIGI